MIVAIHQPNYLPWLGYFAKMARADVFVFLDDAQYSKNSYINRVQIDAGGEPRWLTVPVSYHFGDPIGRVRASKPDWRRSHLDTLRNCYRGAPSFESALAIVERAFDAAPDADIATVNQSLIEAVAGTLSLRCVFRRASNFDTAGLSGDDRLIAIVRQVSPGATYLSGKGGANYQDGSKFEAAGLALRYTDFRHPDYEQGHGNFLPGLSVLDALFRLGAERTAALLAPVAAAA
jgi:hypothetical protein